MRTQILDVWVAGRPRTKGSLAGGRTGAGAQRLSDTALSKAWRAAVCNAVIPEIATERDGKWILRERWPRRGPVAIQIVAHYQRSTNDAAPCPTSVQYGDVDKAARNVLDALQAAKGSAGVFADDAQVVELAIAKRFAGFRGEGMQITVWELE